MNPTTKAEKSIAALFEDLYWVYSGFWSERPVWNRIVFGSLFSVVRRCQELFDFIYVAHN